MQDKKRLPKPEVEERQEETSGQLGAELPLGPKWKQRQSSFRFERKPPGVPVKQKRKRKQPRLKVEAETTPPEEKHNNTAENKPADTTATISPDSRATDNSNTTAVPVTSDTLAVDTPAPPTNIAVTADTLIVAPDGKHTEHGSIPPEPTIPDTPSGDTSDFDIPKKAPYMAADTKITYNAEHEHPAPKGTEKHSKPKNKVERTTPNDTEQRPSSKLRQEPEQPRPSDRLRHEDGGDTPTPDTSGQVGPKLDKKEARDEKRINKSKLRTEKTGAKLNKAKKKLAEQKPYKPPGVAKTLTWALGNEAWGQVHSQFSKHERDNVGLEAAHSIEQRGETAMRTTTRFVKRRIRTRPRRQVVKWENKNIKANADLRFRQMAQENPELKKNAYKRFIQKRRLKQQFKKQAKEAAKKGAVKTAEKTASGLDKAARALAGLIKKNPTAVLIVIMLFLLVVVLQSCMGGAFTIGNGLSGAIGGTSYLANDEDINAADLNYTEWETDLLLKAKNAAATHPGYDEYRYVIGNIGHNPFELLAFLTTKYDGFTYAGIESVLREIFAEQYTIAYSEATETRGEGENATTVRILTTTLTARSFSDVIATRITTQDERERYNVYMFLKGNRQCIGKPFDMEWLPYVSSYYGYRVHPVSGAKDYHTGVDIAVQTGTEILAGGTGTVLEAGNGGNYGLTLLIDYEKGITARYAHCSALRVSVGQSVKIGDVIALSGNTGNSTGPHLHIEVMKDGAYMNPLFYVDGTQGNNGPVFGNPGSPMGDGSYAALIAEAEKYIGKPYVFGGSTPSTSFDCSGYICWIFTQSGVHNLPRTTAQGIYNQCTPISQGEAKPGDLIFFHSTYSCPDVVTHIGLYVGEGRMLHCGNPIGYTSTNSSYWQQHFYAFGRLVN